MAGSTHKGVQSVCRACPWWTRFLMRPLARPQDERTDLLPQRLVETGKAHSGRCVAPRHGVVKAAVHDHLELLLRLEQDLCGMMCSPPGGGGGDVSPIIQRDFISMPLRFGGQQCTVQQVGTQSCAPVHAATPSMTRNSAHNALHCTRQSTWQSGTWRWSSA